MTEEASNTPDVEFVVERVKRDPEMAYTLARRIRRLDQPQQPQREFTEEDLRRGGERLDDLFATQWEPRQVRFAVEWLWGKEAADHLAKLEITEQARKAAERVAAKERASTCE